MTAAKNLAVVEQAKEQLKGFQYPRKYHTFKCPDYEGVEMTVWFNYPNDDMDKVIQATQDMQRGGGKITSPWLGTEFVSEWNVPSARTGEPLPLLGEVGLDELSALPGDLFSWISETIRDAAALAKQERLGNSPRR